MNSKNKTKILNVLAILVLLFSFVLLVCVHIVLAETLKIDRSEAIETEVPDNTTTAPSTPPSSTGEARKDYIEQFNATVTAYTAIETCGTTCTMANGKRAYVGAAACPRRIPLGTWVNIDGIGIVVCEDRTALWTDGRFDVFIGYDQSAYQRALQFGKSVKLVTINHSLWLINSTAYWQDWYEPTSTLVYSGPLAS